MFDLDDLRYAWRLLRKNLGFTALTVLVLAGGLAISLYTYGVLNTLLYKDLPLPEGGEIVRITGAREGRIAPLDAYLLAEMRAGDLKSVREVGVYTNGTAQLSDGDSRRSVGVIYAEWNLFEFARTRPMLGRGFVREDNVDGAESVVVLGYQAWQNLFAGDPAILDKVVQLNHKPTRVVGVMPKDFAFPVADGVWQPMAHKDMAPTGYSQLGVNAYARLAPGASAGEARAELDEALRRVQAQHRAPEGQGEALDGVLVLSYQAAQTYPEGPFVFGILNVVSFFILLLACVNVGNMLLARTNERIREIAIRVALGAPRGRLVLQMMLESLLVCVAGGVLALALAGWALWGTNRFLASALEGNLPYWWRWGLDRPTLLAGVGFVVLAVALVSALPTFSATQVDSNAILRDGTRGARGRTSGRISRALVTVEIVLISVVMVVGSAMAILAYRTAHLDFGMDTTHLVTMAVNLDGEKYAKPDQQLLFYQRLLAEVRQDPQIEAAVVSDDLGETAFAVDGQEYARPEDYPRASEVVSSETPVPVGTRLIEGRNFDARDSADGLKSVVISQTLAQTYWPGASALGRPIRLVNDAGVVQEQRVVVGVVSDVRRGQDLFTTDRRTFAALYVPLPQAVQSGTNLLVRHRGDEGAARDALYRAVAKLDSYLVPGPVRSYSEMQRKLTLMATTMTDLFVRCGLFALLLAMTGIYGLTSNAIVQRTQEIGLRRAIGASDGSIVALFLRQSGRTLAVGLGASALISFAILYFLAKFAGVGAAALSAVALAVALAVAALVLFATYVSTRRAVAPEPSIALRYE